MEIHVTVKPFVWQCHDGRQLRPAQMRTSHLFYTVRMIFNHLVPPVYQIPGCKRWGGIEKMDPVYLRLAVIAMSFELERRCNGAGEALPPWMEEQIKHMNEACGQLLHPRLN